jgi:hypothetical protein
MGLPARPAPEATTWGFAEEMAIFGKSKQVIVGKNILGGS